MESTYGQPNAFARQFASQQGVGAINIGMSCQSSWLDPFGMDRNSRDHAAGAAGSSSAARCASPAGLTRSTISLSSGHVTPTPSNFNFAFSSTSQALASPTGQRRATSNPLLTRASATQQFYGSAVAAASEETARTSSPFSSSPSRSPTAKNTSIPLKVVRTISPPRPVKKPAEPTQDASAVSTAASLEQRVSNMDSQQASLLKTVSDLQARLSQLETQMSELATAAAPVRISQAMLKDTAFPLPLVPDADGGSSTAVGTAATMQSQTDTDDVSCGEASMSRAELDKALAWTVSKIDTLVQDAAKVQSRMEAQDALQSVLLSRIHENAKQNKQLETTLGKLDCYEELKLQAHDFQLVQKSQGLNVDALAERLRRCEVLLLGEAASPRCASESKVQSADVGGSPFSAVGSAVTVAPSGRVASREPRQAREEGGVRRLDLDSAS